MNKTAKDFNEAAEVLLKEYKAKIKRLRASHAALLTALEVLVNTLKAKSLNPMLNLDEHGRVRAAEKVIREAKELK